MSYDVFLQKSINKIIKTVMEKKQKNPYFPYFNNFHKKSSEASQEEVKLCKSIRYHEKRR